MMLPDFPKNRKKQKFSGGLFQQKGLKVCLRCECREKTFNPWSLDL
ncbi:hypothetical protein SCOR_29655 [Sulfidibacter corallicola]